MDPMFDFVGANPRGAGANGSQFMPHDVLANSAAGRSPASWSKRWWMPP